MKIYRVTWSTPQGYGPLGEDGCRYQVEIITAPTAAIARRVVKKSHPTAEVFGAVLLWKEGMAS